MLIKVSKRKEKYFETSLNVRKTTEKKAIIPQKKKKGVMLSQKDGHN